LNREAIDALGYPPVRDGRPVFQRSKCWNPPIIYGIMGTNLALTGLLLTQRYAKSQGG